MKHYSMSLIYIHCSRNTDWIVNLLKTKKYLYQMPIDRSILVSQCHKEFDVSMVCPTCTVKRNGVALFEQYWLTQVMVKLNGKVTNKKFFKNKISIWPPPWRQYSNSKRLVWLEAPNIYWKRIRYFNFKCIS
jgi:hypothetical protein